MQHEFPFLQRAKISNYVCGICMILGSTYVIINPKIGVVEHRYAVFFLVVGVLLILDQSGKKIIVETDAIIKVTLFRKKQIAFDDIEAIKIDDKFIALISNSPHKKDLYIHDYKYLRDSKHLVNFLKARFEDAGELSFKKGKENRAYDPAYGFTAHEREANFAKLNKIASIINWAGVFFALAIFIPFLIFKAIAIAIPPLCLLLVWGTNNRIKLWSNFSAAAYPIVQNAFIAPIITLFLKSFKSYDLYSTDNLWVPSLALSMALIVFHYFININDLQDTRKNNIITLTAILIIGYSFASVRMINCAFDRSAGQIYKPVVVKKKTSTRISEITTTQVFNFTLSKWGTDQKAGDMEVDRNLYMQTRVGDTVRITVRPGLLNIPWYIVGK